MPNDILNSFQSQKQKLSTDALKDLITKWMHSDPSIATSIEEQYEDVKVAYDFTQGKSWKRREKYKIDYEAFMDLVFQDPKNNQWVTSGGSWEGIQQDVLRECIASDESKHKGFIFRHFAPKGDPEDNYRLEVITTSDDSDWVCWYIVED